MKKNYRIKFFESKSSSKFFFYFSSWESQDIPHIFPDKNIWNATISKFELAIRGSIIRFLVCSSSKFCSWHICMFATRQRNHSVILLSNDMPIGSTFRLEYFLENTRASIVYSAWEMYNVCRRNNIAFAQNRAKLFGENIIIVPSI